MTGRKRIAVAAAALAFFFAAVLGLLAFNANRIIKFELEKRLGRDFSVGSVSLGPGGIQAKNVKIKKNGEPFLEAERVVIKAGILGFLEKRYVISTLLIERPVLYLRTDRTGKLSIPFGPSGGKAKNGGVQGGAPPFELKRVEIRDGKLLYIDGKVANPPHVTRLEAVRLDMENIRVPADGRWTGYALSARIPGRPGAASLKLNGKTDLESFDTDAKISLSRLDITGFKPTSRRRATPRSCAACSI